MVGLRHAIHRGVLLAGLASGALVLASGVGPAEAQRPAAPAASAAAAINWHGCPKYRLCLYKHSNYRGAAGYDRPDDTFFYCDRVYSISGYTFHAGSIVNHQVASSSDDGTGDTYQYYPSRPVYAGIAPTYRGGSLDLYPVNKVVACHSR